MTLELDPSPAPFADYPLDGNVNLGAAAPSLAGLADRGSHRTKRIACALCRKRKLRCDGLLPDQCSNCKRLNKECIYDEVRKKSGPKRGYVRHLEARLEQVETLLRDTAPRTAADSGPDIRKVNSDYSRLSLGESMAAAMPPPAPVPPISADMVSLGYEEPLPSDEVTNEL